MPASIADRTAGHAATDNTVSPGEAILHFALGSAGFTQRPCALESRTPAPPTVSSVDTPALAGEDVQGEGAGGVLDVTSGQGAVTPGAPGENDRPASIPEVIAPEPFICSWLAPLENWIWPPWLHWMTPPATTTFGIFSSP
jgi:hypothetical protein